jgi:hypothetical protein
VVLRRPAGEGGSTLARVLDLPRAARLALWGSAALRGEIPPGTAARAVTRDDEPHRVSGADAACRDGTALLERLAAGGSRALRVALPVPGDLTGLAGPPAFNAEAIEAGEAVLAEDRLLGLVPEVVEFGSALEPGAMVTWHVHEAAPSRVTDLGSLADADRALREALVRATEALAALDVARWREDDTERIAAVRDGALARDVLPPGADPRVARVLATAARVRAMVELALLDDGAAVTGWEASERSRALREVDSVARRALVAAVNSAVAQESGRSSASR